MFHVSRRDLGRDVVLKPQIPSAATKNECRQTPRVCFAPTINKCLIGLVGFGVSEDITLLAAFMELSAKGICPTVYWTSEDLFQPDHAEDFHVTEEHWALNPVSVVRVGYVDLWALLEKKAQITSEPSSVIYPENEFKRAISKEDRKAFLSAL